MYPGLVYSDCWVAEQRYHDLVAEGARQQAFLPVSATSRGARPALTPLRQHVASLLARAGRRLLDAQSVGADGLDAPPVPPRRAVAA